MTFSASDTDQRLTNLEIKASFAEDLVEQLNQIVSRQQQDIDLLMREVRQLRQQTLESAANTTGQVGHELPPHY
jgi:SlyX protein